MTVSVSCENYSIRNDCSDYTTWNGETPAAVTDFYITGTGCVGFTVRGDGNNDVYVDNGTYDFSGTPRHVRFWFMTTTLKELVSEASGGLQFYVTDGSNTAYWVFGGGDTYPGGWWPVVVDLSASPTSGTKPTNMAACTSFGVRMVHTGTAKNTQNTWIDHVYVGDGLIAYGDDAGGSFGLENILAADISTSNGWGIIRKIGGVYYVTGSLKMGDGSSTNSCDFAETSADIVFEDRPVYVSVYAIEVVGNGTGTTSFVMGAKAGSRGISGCFVHTESTTQTPKYTVTCTDTDVGTFKLYGCTFLDASTVSLPTSSANREVISCNFEECGPIVSSTCKVQYCNVIKADDVGVQIGSTSHNVSDCSIVQCGHGIEFTATGSYSLSNMLFSGADGSSYYDIENSNNGTTCDSYSESNRDGDESLDDTTTAVGQSFAGNSGVLGHCYFVLSKSGSPTGNAVAKVYAHSGTYGTDGVPTGAALATSLPFDVSVLDGTPTLVKFVFPVASQITLSATYYFVVIEYSAGDSGNYVLVGRDGSSPSHGGNLASYTTGWAADNTKDGCFYVRTGGIVDVSATGTSNPAQAYVDDTGTPEGTTAIANTKTLTITCKNEAGIALEGVGILIETYPGGVAISSGTTNSSGVYTDSTYNYGGDVDVKVIARIKGKVNNQAFDEITVNGLSIPFTMVRDKSVNLP